MKEKKEVRENKGMQSYLLAARAKEIARLKEELAGWEETGRLFCAFMALLSLAVAGEAEATEAVTCEACEEGVLGIRVSKAALHGVLDCWQTAVKKEENAYQIFFTKNKEDNEK